MAMHTWILMSDAFPCRVRRDQAISWMRQHLRQRERSGGEPPSQLVAWWALAEITNQRLGLARELREGQHCIVLSYITI